MGRIWSLLFLLVPILGVGVFVFAAAEIGPFKGHWLPKDISEHGRVIDQLFMFILYLTGAISSALASPCLVSVEVRCRQESGTR